MNTFFKARITLTLWYILISIVMLAIFSFAAVSAERRAFSRIESVLGDPVQRPYLTRLLEERLDNFSTDFLRRLLFFDVILLGFSAGASWFLSGKTLRPIQTMVHDQETFAADVSHELRTPLTTAMMEIESVKRISQQIPRKYLSVFNSIQDEMKRMSTLVEGLLLLVRPDKQIVSFALVDFTYITNQTCAKMNLLAQEKQLKYDYQIDKNISVRGDPDELTRLITIFIDNAIRYTSKSGKVKVTLTQSKTAAILTVSDTGIGIDNKDIGHIFERFYRSRAVGGTKGTGLGLSIARKILDQHGGDIAVESILGKGSTFILKLPIVS